jgi:hypothetical protein
MDESVAQENRFGFAVNVRCINVLLEHNVMSPVKKRSSLQASFSVPIKCDTLWISPHCAASFYYFF